jgi:hypothetical protein
MSDNRQHGRLFARYKLAKIVTAACHTDAYSQEEPLAVKGRKSIVSPALPLVRWTDNHWTDLENLLLTARDALIRVDADSLDTQDSQPDAERKDSDLYTTKVDSLLRYIRVNRAFSDIRWNLQKQLVDKATNSVKIDSAALAKFGYVEYHRLVVFVFVFSYFDGLAHSFSFYYYSDTVEKDFINDDQARQALEKLLVRGKPGTATRSGGVSLVSGQELQAILNKRPFDLSYISNKLESLLQRWARDVFEKPILTRLGYNPVEGDEEVDFHPIQDDESEEEEEEKAQPAVETQPPRQVVDENVDENEENELPPARRPKRKCDQDDSYLATLKSARKNLHNDGKDPMQEILANAAKAVGGTIFDKKPSAKQVQFDDSDSEEEEGVQLSDLPARAKVTRNNKSPPKASPKKPGKRKKFTEQEKRAIRQGVGKHGEGKWSEIKSEYAEILKDRTTVNIKVRLKGRIWFYIESRAR